MCGKIFKVQVKLMGFNVTEFKKLIDMRTDFIVQLTFEKLPPVKYWLISKEEYMQLS